MEIPVPGVGVYSRHPSTGNEKEASGGVPQTTNNQMELQAVIEGLGALKRRLSVEVITDSVYVAKGAREWLPGWKRKRLAEREKNRWVPVKNVELWQALDTLMARHDVRFTTIAGHSGHTENDAATN